MIIEAYNSSYPLSYYSVGTVYAFYSASNAEAALAEPQYVSKFAKVLQQLKQDEEKRIIKPVGGAVAARKGNLSRYYGVVVEIERGSKGGKIQIMFSGNAGGEIQYYTKWYAVSYGCTTDGKDLMPVSAMARVQSSAKVSTAAGSITHLADSNTPGRITHIDGASKSSADRPTSIGDITHMTAPIQADTPSGDGITHIVNRGGITHMDH